MDLAALTGKILCRKHNGELDSVVKQGFETLDSSLRLFQLRSKLKMRRWTIRTFTIDGALLERWFLKALIKSTLTRAYLWKNSRPRRSGPAALIRLTAR